MPDRMAKLSNCILCKINPIAKQKRKRNLLSFTPHTCRTMSFLWYKPNKIAFLSVERLLSRSLAHILARFLFPNFASRYANASEFVSEFSVVSLYCVQTHYKISHLPPKIIVYNEINSVTIHAEWISLFKLQARFVRTDGFLFLHSTHREHKHQQWLCFAHCRNVVSEEKENKLQ